MPSWAVVLVIALGGAMLLEGAVYALFPEGMKQAMREIQNFPESQLRAGGLVVAALGLGLICLIIPGL